MTLAWWILAILAGTAVLFVVALVVFTIYVIANYVPHVERIFVTKPLFLAPQVSPIEDAEHVELRTPSGRRIAASYLQHKTADRRGVVLFCHEFLANRWLAGPYVNSLRDDGFDVFTFDFCNHGESDSIDGYDPLQWTTEHEIEDLRAAVDYLKSRPDAPVRIGLHGVSRGAATGLALAGEEPFIGAVVGDSAFPTLGTVTYYEMIWVGIYSTLPKFYSLVPRSYYSYIAALTIKRIGRKRGVQYANVEAGVRRYAGRPLLLIHGARDNYIKAIIVERLIAEAGADAELWIVDKAKHNGCMEKAGEAYQQRVRDFFLSTLNGAGDRPAEGVDADDRDRRGAASQPAGASSQNEGSLP